MCCCNIKSFCGLSLRSAGVVIGWVSAVISLLQSIICITALANMDGIMNIVETNYEANDTQLAAIRTIITVVLSVRLGVSLLDSATSILVIIGIHKNSELMLLPWLINNMIDLVLKMIIISILLVFVQLLLPLLVFIIWGIHCYAWIAIQAHYQGAHGSSGEDHIYLK